MVNFAGALTKTFLDKKKIVSIMDRYKLLQLLLQLERMRIMPIKSSSGPTVHTLSLPSGAEIASQNAENNARQRCFYVAMDVYNYAAQAGKSFHELSSDQSARLIAQSLLGKRKHVPAQNRNSSADFIVHNWLRAQITTNEVKSILAMFFQDNQLITPDMAHTKSTDYGHQKSQSFIGNPKIATQLQEYPTTSISGFHIRGRVLQSIRSLTR
jgi:hypothetical protein